ncbi:unnamed protein product [Adineta ricciae]|uniref:Uncharacterized protein n=1 Tax=Adineta ricciae TaxID=249248 RepID=A0A815X9W3_ADIRI|nr:unnamed protein product [Adineta ricciae]
MTSQSPDLVPTDSIAIVKTRKSYQCLRSLSFQITVIVLITFGVAIAITTVIAKSRNRTKATPSKLTTSSTASVILKTRGSTTSTTSLVLNLSTTTIFAFCNVTNCRKMVLSYIDQGWAFDTTQLGECVGCPAMANFEVDSGWSTMWTVENFFIEDSLQQDSDSRRFVGDVKYCERHCFRDAECIGFSREKRLSSDEVDTCWFISSTMSNKTYNHTEWYTILLKDVS